MEPSIIDVMKIDVVLLGDNNLNDESAVDSLKRALDLDDLQIARGLATNALTGENSPAITVSINRERTLMEALPNRLAVGKEYPQQTDINRVAEITMAGIDCSTLRTQDSVPRGYNAEVLFRLDNARPAAAFISEHLLKSDQLGKDDWEPIGQYGRVVYQQNDRRWTFSVEPRNHDFSTPILYVATNLHIENQPIPDLSTFVEELSSVWLETQEFVGRLDRSTD